MAQMNPTRSALCGVALLALLAGCATKEPVPAAPASPTAPAAPKAPAPAAAASASAKSPKAAPTYRCENGVQFTLRTNSDSAVMDMGARGSESLLRDAGGMTPEQTVYSNARIRAEFGLGAQGREAVLRYIASPLVVKCAIE